MVQGGERDGSMVVLASSLLPGSAGGCAVCESGLMRQARGALFLVLALLYCGLPSCYARVQAKRGSSGKVMVKGLQDDLDS